MKKLKKAQHCLFVEDEVYNWASTKNNVNRVLLSVGLLTILLALLFNVLG